MWVSTKETFDNSLMFFQFKQKNDICIFNFTNLKQFFTKTVHKSSLSSIYSKTNKIIEVKIENIIDFLDNINETNNIIFNFATSEELIVRTFIIIKLTDGFPSFTLEFDLELKDFYSNFTFPLLKLIKLLKKNEKDLLSILKKKDLEIAEYKLEGCSIIHESIKTDIFNEDFFLSNTLQDCDDSLNLCEISSLIEQINNRCPDVFDEKVNHKPNIENDELQKQTFKKKYDDQGNTTTIKAMPIPIKKNKKIKILKNL